MSFNKVILMGNLTRDPEYRVTPSGHQICKLGIAVSRRFTTQSGEQREETAFVDVDAWGRQAETISRYFNKGKPILVEGRLRMDQWQNQQGENRSKLVVQLESFSFVGGPGQGDQQGGGQPGGYQQQPQSQASSQPGQPQPFTQQPAPPQPAQGNYAPPPPVSTPASPEAPAPSEPAQSSAGSPPQMDDEEEDVPF